MATILEAIEGEVSNLSRKTRFEYVGDLEEANATILDKLASGDFPVCLCLAFDITDYDRAHTVVNSQAELNLLFLDRIHGASIDLPTTEIDSKVISPMRELTRELINRLDRNDVIVEDGISNVVHRNTYQPVGDAHLFGNWAVVPIKFSEDTGVCPPD